MSNSIYIYTLVAFSKMLRSGALLSASRLVAQEASQVGAKLECLETKVHSEWEAKEARPGAKLKPLGDDARYEAVTCWEPFRRPRVRCWEPFGTQHGSRFGYFEEPCR